MAIGSKRSSPTAPAAAAVFSEDMIEPRKTPCSQSRASWMSGTTVERRPPKSMASIGHAGRVVVLGRRRRALADRRREAGVGVGGGRVGLGRPFVAAPVDGVLGRLAGQALPPHVAVVGLGAVGEHRVARDGVDRVGVGARARARGHAEEAGLGVDRVELAVGAELHPGDVVADRLDLPVGQRRHEHGQVGLAAGAREGAGDVLDRALGRGELEDEHVLGQPALVAGHDRGDAQGEALLAQQRVAAVARAEGPDLAGLGEVDDVLVVGVARPGDILDAVAEGHAHRVQAGHELAVLAEAVQRVLAHPGHDPHRGGHVGRVGQLHADVGDRGAERAHREGHDVHRASAHRAAEQVGEATRASPSGRASCWSARRPPRARSR